MRLTKERAAQNRQTILDTAGRLFRERGFDGVGVADLMNEAGFTHGGFYNHFASKQALAAAVCAWEIARANRGLADALEGDAKGKAWERYVEQYLSRDHRDHPGRGCTVAALAGDAGREDEAVQGGFAGGLEEVLAILTDVYAGSAKSRPAARARALRVYSELVGALILSRSVAAANPALADEILAASRRRKL
jgi:TetR/AcrR family transcriptional regulator, transcriptional repressor for nem operon